MKAYSNPKSISFKDYNIIKQGLNIEIEINETVASDLMITAKKSDGSSEKTLIFITTDFNEILREKMSILLKNLENLDAWVILFVLQENMEKTSEVMLELFQFTCEELNVMIFPVLDFFEIRDWIANHFKVHNSEIFNNLKGIRNDILIEDLKNVRKSFVSRLASKPASKEFGQQFLENPGHCIYTYYQNRDTKNLHTKEDFNHLLNHTLEFNDQTETIS